MKTVFLLFYLVVSLAADKREESQTLRDLIIKIDQGIENQDIKFSQKFEAISNKIDLLIHQNQELKDELIEMHSEDPEYLNSLFNSFKLKHNKSYSNKSEHDHRFDIFKKHAKLITQHNTAFASGDKSYYLALNHHSDKSPEEFNQWLQKGLSEQYSTRNTVQKSSTTVKPSKTSFNNESSKIPSKVDYRSFLPAIKNQQECGSCWAFAAAATLEFHYNKANNGSRISFSEGQIADCTYKDKFDYECMFSYCTLVKRNGCDGGFPAEAFEYLKQIGITTESDYPYGPFFNVSTAKTSECHLPKNGGYATVSKVFSLDQIDENSLIETIAEHGVVTVLIDATGFQHYAGGIFDGEECSSYMRKRNHAVVLVGYDSDHYILRNSWSDTWGEQGYMKLKRGRNACGVANTVNYVEINILKNV